MYLVTGGSGFCGWAIVQYLLSKKESVRVLDIEPLPGPSGGIDFVQADIRDPEAVRSACRGVSHVIHTVAKVPISKAGKGFFDVNVGGTRNVLESALALGIGKVVHISSSAVQISNQNPVDEAAPYRPVGLYARTKMEAELVCLDYIKKGLDVDMIRPRTVVGMGRLGIFDILFEWISEGKNVYLIGDGSNKIQFLHSGDLAACCYLSSRHKGAESYNVGSAAYASLREDLGCLIEHAKSRSKIVSLPISLSIAALASLDFLRLSPLASWHYLTYHRNFYFNNEKAGRLLGWKPRYDNRGLLIEAYDDYVGGKGKRPAYGTSHRKPLRQAALAVLKRLS